MAVTIDNKKESAVGGSWSNPGASLYDMILESPNWKSVLKEAYLIAPVGRIKNNPREKTSFSASDVGYPHHVIRGGKLVLHTTGLKAAYSRAAQQGIATGAVKAHLVRHYREMDWYEESTISEDEVQHTGLTYSQIEDIKDIVLQHGGWNKEAQASVLEHHGIKGMRWGVRRYRDSSTGRVIPGKYISTNRAEQLREQGGATPSISPSISTPSTAFAPAATPSATSTSSRPTNISEMSTKDLQDLITKMKLEREYKQLTAKEVSPGRKFVSSVMHDAGKKALTTFVSSQMLKGLNTLAKELGSGGGKTEKVEKTEKTETPKKKTK